MRTLQRFWRDIGFGARNLLKSPSFTAIALGSLALGIGGSTAMYSVIHAVILDPFPYKDVDRLMTIGVYAPDQHGFGGYYPVDQFVEIADRTTAFDGVIASTVSDVIWTGAGDPQRLRGNHCTGNTFAIMGVPALLGRVATPADTAPGAQPVTVLGYKFWQRQFGGDPGVIGRELHLNDKVRTVVGVMPPRFMWRGADVYLPVAFHRGEITEGVQWVHALGRLKPGVTVAQGEANVRPVIEDLARRDPKSFPEKFRAVLVPFKKTFPSGIQDALWTLFGAVGLLLLISCVNVSNLLLSRAAFRRREIAIRASLGAGRALLVGQLLAESLVLGLGGGALGVAAAFAGLRGIIAAVPPGTIPDEAQIAMNAPVLWFTLAVSVAAALLFGVAPALHISGGDLVTPLKESGRGLSGTTRQRWLRGAMVVGEVALSLMLLVGASLMMRTLGSIQGVEPGRHPDRILTMRIPFVHRAAGDDENRSVFSREVLRRINAVPGVVAAGINTGVPAIFNAGTEVDTAGEARQDQRPVLFHQTDHRYASAMGLRLAAGRFFTEEEVAGGLHDAVVNQAFARRYFAGKSALARVVRLPRLDTLADSRFEIIGVVRDTVNRLATNDVIPEIYIPYTLLGRADHIAVLCQGRPESLEKALRAQVYAVNPDQPVMDVKTVEKMLAEYVYARPRFNLFLFAIFAALGLTLALLGVYGVISSAVAQQTREIGIRIALGAGFGQVMRMILSGGARLLAIGIAAGLAASLASVKVLSGLVRNVSTFDPYAFCGVAFVVFAAGLFASFWPARRAANVDPVTALRDE